MAGGRPGRPAIPIERVEERTWWPLVLIGNASMMNPNGDAEKELCWRWDRGMMRMVYLGGKQLHVRRALLLALRPEFLEEIGPGRRLVPREGCAAATATDVGCINPWHQVAQQRAIDARSEFVLRNRDWDYRPRTFQTALGGVAFVGEVADELYVRCLDDEEFVPELIDGSGHVRMNGDVYERVLVSPMVAVELDKMLHDDEIDAGAVRARVHAKQRVAVSAGGKSDVLKRLARARKMSTDLDERPVAAAITRKRAKASGVRPRPAKRVAK